MDSYANFTIRKGNVTLFYRFTSALLILALSFTQMIPYASAQSISPLNLPVPGTMVTTSEAFVPVLLKGMTLNLKDPFHIDFIVDSGNTSFASEDIKKESDRLVKYFMASMTVPKNDLWVNLAPGEKDRIIPEELGKTELGRDLLAQDYILKQLSSSLMYPDSELGAKFWEKVYSQAQEKYGVTDIPLNTFNKVWILPESATVYEHANSVYITESHLKVMMDEDYKSGQMSVVNDQENQQLTTEHLPLTTAVMKEIILPAIEREVNTGKNFAPLRQIYHSLILAKWYKETVKQSILSQVYIDQNKVSGLELNDPTAKEKIYDQYMEAYKKGVYNYMKEEYDQLSQTIIPRQYFSGGFKDEDIQIGKADGAQVADGKDGKKFVVGVDVRRTATGKANGDQASLSDWIPVAIGTGIGEKVNSEMIQELLSLASNHPVITVIGTGLSLRAIYQLWSRYKVENLWRLKSVDRGVRQSAATTDNDSAMLAPLSVENQRILDEAQRKFNLSPFDKEYLAQMWRQRLSAGTHTRDPLKIILDRNNPQGGNFILASMLNKEERQRILGTTEYDDLRNDPQNSLAAKNAVVTLNSMDGGIGESVDRLEYLKEQALVRARDDAGKRRLTDSDITVKEILDKSSAKIGYEIFIKGQEFENVIRGAKGTDLKYRLTIQGQVVEVSVAEAKLLQLVGIAQKKKYADIAFQPLVNWQSRASYEKLFDQIYLYDRLSMQGPKRTYRQMMEESGVKILPMLEQADLPAIEETNGQVSLNDNAPRQPGGHGQLGFYFLYQTYKHPVVNDGRDHIRVFYNGDNLNSRVNEHIAGVVARNKWPIVKLTTPATRIDKKGGKDGVRVVQIQQADGTIATVYMPDQLEVADAKAVKQEPEFTKAGQINGLGEPGKQPFNTNIFYINETVLNQILNKLTAIIGEENLYQIISPILISKPAKIKDGMSYIPVDGAIGTVMHNLNSYFMTTTDERVKAILSEFGLDRILYFIDVPRTEFFTPIKNNFDLTLQSQSDYYTFNQDQWALQDSTSENVPPEIIVESKDGQFWKEQQNHLLAFGNNLKVKKLASLNIQGKMLLRDAELIGIVKIFNNADETVDLNNYQTSHPELFFEGHPVLNNVTLSIDRDTKQLTVSENQISDPAQLSDVGGIDMNNIEVKKQGSGALIQFDPVDMDAIIKENIQGFVPVIINVTPVNSILPILGLEPPKNKEEYEVSQLN